MMQELTGYKDQWRIRAGDWRLVYIIDDASKRVSVTRVAHRREVTSNRKRNFSSAPALEIPLEYAYGFGNPGLTGSGPDGNSESGKPRTN